MINNFISYCCLLLLVFSCKPSSVDPVPSSAGAEYYPLELGHYTIYKVQNKQRVPGGYNISEYFLKEVVSDTFSEGNENSYRIERFTKDSLNDKWPVQPDSVWSVRFTNNQFIKTENNVRLVKLVLPLTEGKKWNGNTYNSFSKQEYQMLQVGKSYSGKFHHFPATVTVIQQADTSNRVYRHFKKEVFGKGVGLVYKKTELLNLDFNNGDTTSGYIYTQELYQHGN